MVKKVKKTKFLISILLLSLTLIYCFNIVSADNNTAANVTVETNSPNNFIGEDLNSTNQYNQTLTNFLDPYGCCSVIIHVNEGHDIIAHRRDSSSSVNVYINDTFKINGKDALQQYKTYNGSKDFFHLMITNDGWLIGCGGTSSNMELEALTAQIMSFGSINTDFLEKAEMILYKMTKGHFVIKSPDNYVGIVITNNQTQTHYLDLFKMKNGDFICSPNDPYYYRDGIYSTINNDPVLAAIYIVGTDEYAKINRRNLMTYDVLRDSSFTNICIWASFDGGTMVNGSGSPDNIVFHGVTINGYTLPLIPDKLKIGEVLFQIPLNQTNKIDQYNNNLAKTIEMQKTGLPIAVLILAILALFSGLVSYKKF